MNDNKDLEIEWRAGAVPVSKRFDDPYFSLQNGLEETRHVFLGGNDLPNRFQDRFHIAELGFGTGLNLLAAVQAWRAAGQGGKLYFTSFERYPLSPQEMRKALAQFADISELSDEFAPFWGQTHISLADVEFRLIVGDARQSLCAWQGQADAWFLDGFSPAKNPQMWDQDLLMQVGSHTAQGGTFATYTAAGFVRKNLENAGFTVQRLKGYAHKRHMSIGCKAERCRLTPSAKK